mmetsp:Transcript_96285/g.171033  ORF Transcript_96285/g.171033 Transcript_96285/m.171033 type:complete len:182 (+) Transcript_96285:60-605(+)
MAPYRPPMMRGAALPRLVLTSGKTLISTPTPGDTVASMVSRIATEVAVPEDNVALLKDGSVQLKPDEKLDDMGEITLTVKITEVEQVAGETKNLGSQGSESFVGAEIKVTTQSNQEIIGELFCMHDGSCVIRQALPNGNANFHWLKMAIIQKTVIVKMPPAKSKKELPSVDLQKLEQKGKS